MAQPDICKHSRIYGGGGLFDYSVKSGPDLSRLRLSLVRLVTRSTKARFGQVGDQVSQVKDQVCQGQGQELDNRVVTYLPIIL